ncbi:MAG TPA: hypothetical protein VFJ55_04435 [Chthoniobacterales bacterium]|nr:hypothetical protein [Chthoniobacterales bacterium]
MSYGIVVALAIYGSAATAPASYDLRSLKGFEQAFRRAHDSHQPAEMERLVCWDGTTPEMRKGMREALREGIRYPIDAIEAYPYAIEARVHGPLQRPNIKPESVFSVRYFTGREEGHLMIIEIHYIIGKKNGRFQFVVGSRRPLSFTHIES